MADRKITIEKSNISEGKPPPISNLLAWFRHEAEGHRAGASQGWQDAEDPGR